jgi:hypothetical protein
MESGTPFPDTPRASSIARFAAIGVVVAGIASLFAYAGGWLTPHRLTPNAMVNTFEAVNGSYPPGSGAITPRASVSAVISRAMGGASLCPRPQCSVPVVCR